MEYYKSIPDHINKLKIPSLHEGREGERHRVIEWKYR